MPRRSLRALLAFVAGVTACRSEDDQRSRPLPAPEAPATSPSASPATTPGTVPVERRRERPSGGRGDDSLSERDSAATGGPAASGSLPPAEIPSALPAASAPQGVPGSGGESRADCQQGCQAKLQACLSQAPADPDAGTNLDDIARCKSALDQCKAACSP